MDVMFTNPIDWTAFYSQFDEMQLGSTNDSGWTNVNCKLHTHPKTDLHRHGGINLLNGRYKCFNLECVSYYKDELGIKDDRESVSAIQYLMLRQGLDRSEAAQSVESFRLQAIDVGKSPDSVHFNSFSKVYRPMLLWHEFMDAAKARLDPNLEIVHEYMESRGISYETLVEAEIGYVPAEGSQVECIVHPYYIGNNIVGIRGRTIDGRKGGVRDSYSTFYGMQLLGNDPTHTVILAEGETDTLTIRQLLRQSGLDTPVLGIPGSTYDVSWNRHLQGISRVLFVAQTDSASQKLARSIQALLPGRAEIIQLPFGPRDIGKDVSDYVRISEEYAHKFIELLGISATEEVQPYTLGLIELFKAAEEEIAWNINGVLEKDTKIILAGAPKTHKTWLALELAQAIYTGEPWLNNPEWAVPNKGLRTLIVEEEGSLRRLGQRVKSIFAGVDPVEHDKAIQIVHRQRVRLDEVPTMDKLRGEILEYWPDMLVLDPYVNLHSRDENSASEMTVVMDTINVLMRLRPGMVVVILHHLSKAGDLRGSTANFGAADAKFVLTKKEGNITMSAEGREMEELSNIDIHFDPVTKRHSYYVPEEQETASNEEVDADVLEFVTASGLCTAMRIRTALSQQLAQHTIIAINKSIQRLVHAELLHYTPDGQIKI